MPIPNTLTELTTYIPMASAMLGAIIGGTISWINLNRQFNEQRKREQLQERKQERIALNSVLKELDYNHTQLLVYRGFLKNSPDLKIENYLKNDKWIKHSDVIEYMEGLDFLTDLQKFYFFLDYEIKRQDTDLKGTNTLLSLCNDLIPKITQHLKELKKGK